MNLHVCFFVLLGRTVNWDKTGQVLYKPHTCRGMDQLPAVSIKDAITASYTLHTPEISQVSKNIQDIQHTSWNTLYMFRNTHGSNTTFTNQHTHLNLCVCSHCV